MALWQYDSKRPQPELLNGFDAHGLKKFAAPQTPHGFPLDSTPPAALGPFPYSETSLTRSSFRPLSILEDEVVQYTYKNVFYLFFFKMGRLSQSDDDIL